MCRVCFRVGVLLNRVCERMYSGSCLKVGLSY